MLITAIGMQVCGQDAGFITGLMAPVAAIAGAVALIRLVTGKVPFLGHIYEGEDGERHLSFKFVAPDEAEGLLTEYKERFGGELSGLQTEIKALIAEAQGQAAAATDEQLEEEIIEEA